MRISSVSYGPVRGVKTKPGLKKINRTLGLVEAILEPVGHLTGTAVSFSQSQLVIPLQDKAAFLKIESPDQKILFMFRKVDL